MGKVGDGGEFEKAGVRDSRGFETIGFEMSGDSR